MRQGNDLLLHTQCIAYSGVVPEFLLTHDPSRSRFRVYFKRSATGIGVGMKGEMVWTILPLDLPFKSSPGKTGK